jgi:hypothetical protein
MLSQLHGHDMSQNDGEIWRVLKCRHVSFWVPWLTQHIAWWMLRMITSHTRPSGDPVAVLGLTRGIRSQTEVPHEHWACW